MPAAASVAGNASRLYCGLVRERGTVRTSTTIATDDSASSAMKSSTGRVECPIVKNGITLAARPLLDDLDCRPRPFGALLDEVSQRHRVDRAPCGEDDVAAFRVFLRRHDQRLHRERLVGSRRRRQVEPVE